MNLYHHLFAHWGVRRNFSPLGPSPDPPLCPFGSSILTRHLGASFLTCQIRGSPTNMCFFNMIK